MELNLWITAAAGQQWRPPPDWRCALLGALMVAISPAAMAADVNEPPPQMVHPALKNSQATEFKSTRPPIKEIKPKVVRPVVITTPALYLRADSGAGKSTAKAALVAITTPTLYLHADSKARKP